jgi:RHS repeat-associated protein
MDMIEAERTASAPGDGLIGQKRNQYPNCDGHGNRTSSLMRPVGGTITPCSAYALVNEKRYDAWGKAIIVSGPGDSLANPKEGYQVAIGHKYDSESDLIYTRARYYEPGSGRFINEDPAMQGRNWFVYCGNDPIGRVDPNGKVWTLIGQVAAAFVIGFIAGFFFSVVEQGLIKGRGSIDYGVATWDGVIGGAIGAATAFTGGFLVMIAEKMAKTAKLAHASSRIGGFGEGILAFSTSTEWSKMVLKSAGAAFAGARGAVVKIGLNNLRSYLIMLTELEGN